MGKRREGREAAVQFLYQLDLHGLTEAGDTADFWELRAGPEQERRAARAVGSILPILAEHQRPAFPLKEKSLTPAW